MSITSSVKTGIEALINKSMFDLASKPHPEGARAHLLFAPEYRNYGDHAIYQGTRRFLSDCLDTSTELVVETSNFLRYFPDKLDDLVGPQDVLLFMGGGYMGDFWEDSQRVTESVLRRFPDNPVVVLPQTIFFQNQLSPAIDSFAQLLTSRNSLLFCAREDSSFKFCAERLRLRPDQCAVTPDLALYLSDKIWRGKRRGACICLRADVESLKRISYADCAQVLQSDFSLKSRKASTVADTIIPIPIECSSRAVEKTFTHFQQSEVVVTDRLHGMLMAALSATPVVGFDNASGKVSGVYRRWISSLPYVRIAKTDGNLSDDIESVLSVPLDNRVAALENCLSALKIEHFSKLGSYITSFISREMN
jgi:pyruvyl transferase EpsI